MLMKGPGTEARKSSVWLLRKFVAAAEIVHICMHHRLPYRRDNPNPHSCHGSALGYDKPPTPATTHPTTPTTTLPTVAIGRHDISFEAHSI